VEKQGGGHDPQLDVAPVPEGFETWLVMYMEIKQSEHVTYQDINAYERVTGHRLSPVEVSAVFAMDRGAAKAMVEVMKENKPDGR